MALAGVVFMGWSPFFIMCLYWFESVFAGMFNILRMFPAGLIGKDGKINFAGGMDGFGSCLFFLMHYGMFMLLHMLFLMVFDTMLGAQAAQPGPPHEMILEYLAVLTAGVRDSFSSPAGFAQSLWIPLLLMGYAYLREYREQFILTGDYKERVPRDFFMKPYPRILAMQFSLILGFHLVMFLRLEAAPAGAALVGVKTIADIIARRRMARRQQLSS
jgi:hypothetical protein